MKKIAVLLAVLGLSASSVSPGATFNTKAVVYVDCGVSVASAVKVGEDKYITAAHVVDHLPCYVNGVQIKDVDVTAREPRHRQISLLFQNVALFDNMSVLDNVKVGCHSRSTTSWKNAAPAQNNSIGIAVSAPTRPMASTNTEWVCNPPKSRRMTRSAISRHMRRRFRRLATRARTAVAWRGAWASPSSCPPCTRALRPSPMCACCGS